MAWRRRDARPSATTMLSLLRRQVTRLWTLSLDTHKKLALYAIIIIIIIIIRHQVNITQDTYRVTTIKRAMPERGREVGNPLVSLLLAGSSSHTDNAQWRSYCILPGYPQFINDTMSHKNDVIDWTWAKIWSHGPWYCRLGKHGLTLLPAWIFL